MKYIYQIFKLRRDSLSSHSFLGSFLGIIIGKASALFVFVFFGGVSAIMAQNAADSQEPEGKVMVFWDLLTRGGILIYPLILLSFLTVVLILFYFLSIRKSSVVSDSFMRGAEERLRAGDYSELMRHCASSRSAAARISHSALEFAANNPSSTMEEVREVAEAEGARQAGRILARVSYLGDVGAVAPMVGLLGTVIGMIKAFNELGATVGVLQTRLSGGVAEALITTAGGLVVGIVALIFYSYFRAKAQRLIIEMESAVSRVLALLSAQQKKFEEEERVQATEARRT